MKLVDYLGEEKLKEMLEKSKADKDKQSRLKTYKEIIDNPPNPVEWLIESLFPLHSINILGGAGGVGKSWICMLLALCVASGQPLFGQFPSRKGKVLIIDEEAALILASDRLRKLLNGMKLIGNTIPPHAMSDIYTVHDANVKVDKGTGLDLLKDYLAEYHPDLVILDSLIRVHSADENSAQEMQEVFRQVKKLVTSYSTTVLFTHHARKYSKGSNAASQLLRGTTDIRNFADSCLFMSMSKRNPGVRTLIHDKSRFGVEVPPFNIQIEKLTEEATAIQWVEYSRDTITPPKPRISSEAKDKIVDILRTNTRKVERQKIISDLEGIGVNTKDKALKELVEEGKIRVEGGNGKAKKYWIE